MAPSRITKNQRLVEPEEESESGEAWAEREPLRFWSRPSIKEEETAAKSSEESCGAISEVAKSETVLVAMREPWVEAA